MREGGGQHNEDDDHDAKGSILWRRALTLTKGTILENTEFTFTRPRQGRNAGRYRRYSIVLNAFKIDEALRCCLFAQTTLKL